ncbi:hypothetical protein NEHOM01_0816 [Nematocida homosporus]|uniref:uncharacterized protein n=1 Tax=Nematocida homosporus TaxID=1912981 RepID=UPI00221E4B07|nr:uncharacterized protein NEHOM01_0816 [Nematocida homosporus]KAI5185401.1 hypothetical protein NEHOM01_0816 [Nematocida homosporus]
MNHRKGDVSNDLSNELSSDDDQVVGCAPNETPASNLPAPPIPRCVQVARAIASWAGVDCYPIINPLSHVDNFIRMFKLLSIANPRMLVSAHRLMLDKPSSFSLSEAVEPALRVGLAPFPHNSEIERNLNVYFCLVICREILGYYVTFTRNERIHLYFDYFNIYEMIQIKAQDNVSDMKAENFEKHMKDLFGLNKADVEISALEFFRKADRASLGEKPFPPTFGFISSTGDLTHKALHDQFNYFNAVAMSKCVTEKMDDPTAWSVARELYLRVLRPGAQRPRNLGEVEFIFALDLACREWASTLLNGDWMVGDLKLLRNDWMEIVAADQVARRRDGAKAVWRPTMHELLVLIGKYRFIAMLDVLSAHAVAIVGSQRMAVFSHLKTVLVGRQNEILERRQLNMREQGPSTKETLLNQMMVRELIEKAKAASYLANSVPKSLGNTGFGGGIPGQDLTSRIELYQSARGVDCTDTGLTNVIEKCVGLWETVLAETDGQEVVLDEGAESEDGEGVDGASVDGEQAKKDEEVKGEKVKKGEVKSEKVKKEEFKVDMNAKAAKPVQSTIVTHPRPETSQPSTILANSNESIAPLSNQANPSTNQTNSLSPAQISAKPKCTMPAGGVGSIAKELICSDARCLYNQVNLIDNHLIINPMPTDRPETHLEVTRNFFGGLKFACAYAQGLPKEAQYICQGGGSSGPWIKGLFDPKFSAAIGASPERVNRSNLFTEAHERIFYAIPGNRVRNLEETATEKARAVIDYLKTRAIIGHMMVARAKKRKELELAQAKPPKTVVQQVFSKISKFTRKLFNCKAKAVNIQTEMMAWEEEYAAELKKKVVLIKYPTVGVAPGFLNVARALSEVLDASTGGVFRIKPPMNIDVKQLYIDYIEEAKPIDLAKLRKNPDEMVGLAAVFNRYIREFNGGVISHDLYMSLRWNTCNANTTTIDYSLGQIILSALDPNTLWLLKHVVYTIEKAAAQEKANRLSYNSLINLVSINLFAQDIPASMEFLQESIEMTHSLFAAVRNISFIERPSFIP